MLVSEAGVFMDGEVIRIDGGIHGEPSRSTPALLNRVPSWRGRLPGRAFPPPAPRARAISRAKSAQGGPRAFGPGVILAPAMVSQADKDGDKAVTKGEFAALADAWYDKLDADKSGTLGREPFATRLGDLVPLPGAPPAAPRP